MITQSRFEHFEGLVRLAFQGFVNDRINNTLQRASDIANTIDDGTAMAPTEEVELSVPDADDEPADTGKSIITTVEEVEAYELVKTILNHVVDTARIAIRDTKSYCGVLLDDNNRKPICRLRFNAASVKYLGLFNEERNETRYPIGSIDDISGYADQIRVTVERYMRE